MYLKDKMTLLSFCISIFCHLIVFAVLAYSPPIKVSKALEVEVAELRVFKREKSAFCSTEVSYEKKKPSKKLNKKHVRGKAKKLCNRVVRKANSVVTKGLGKTFKPSTVHLVKPHYPRLSRLNKEEGEVLCKVELRNGVVQRF